MNYSNTFVQITINKKRLHLILKMSVFANSYSSIQQAIVCFAVIGFLFFCKILFSIIVNFTVGIKTYLLPRVANHQEDFVNKYGPWAIVTGCTQGIGRSYVDELAKRGMNLVLISRNQSKLEELEKQLQLDYKGNDSKFYFK